MAGKPLASPGEKEVRFGNFEVMNDPEGRPVLLGKGTFGRTYQARHCFLDIIVALKIITERYVADARVRQRFLTEARAVAKLSHPHIARVYDFGEMDGVLHYAMEYCAGGSLADYVTKNGPVPLRRTIEIAQQISGALKCAHTAGFIHRDLKPSNIMLTTPDGPPFTKLIDFGLVQPSVPGATRSFADDQSADGARFLGTPLFASPEQLREEPMDLRTDLFSLGMTLWFLMDGRAPESGSSAEIAASRLNRESYAARLPANLPPQFRDVLGRLLEKDRKNRFASAADVFNALNACAAALGFRQARDYMEPLAAIDSAQASESGALDLAKLEPIEIEAVNAPLSSEFNIVTRINEDFTGLNYVGEAIGTKAAMSILHVLHPMLLEDAPALERFRLHIAQLMRVDVAEIVRPKAIKRYSDHVAVISDKPEGTDLLSVLRTERTVALVEAAPLVEKIADVCDKLCAAGLPGAQLAPRRIFVEQSSDGLSRAKARLYPRFLSVSEAAELARMNEPEDASSTMTIDMVTDPRRADNMGEHFAALLYRVVAGRNCPVAAALSSQAYVAVPSLSEESNRILSMVIARQVEDSSCGKVLREILNAEGIVPRVPGHPSAGFTERPGSSTVSPLAIAPGAVPIPGPGLSRFAPWIASGVLAGLLVIVVVVFFVSKQKLQTTSAAQNFARTTVAPQTTATSKPMTTSATDLDRAEKDYAEAMDYLSGMNRVLIDINEAVRLLRQAANAHLPEAEARLALMTKGGYGGLVKDQSAAEGLANGALADGLVARADDQHPAVENVLGLLYREGLGVPKDVTKAADLFQKAADRGHAGALSNLAYMYSTGSGVPKNLNRAFELLKKAADQGQANAQANLGLAYENGLGVPKNLDRARELYQKAADQGDADGQSYLVVFYVYGRGVPKDLDRAVELSQKAAAQGSPIGQARLGWLYENGFGLPKDFDKAAEFYQKSADQGSAVAQAALGWLYQNGWGVPKDLDKAIELYQKAADQGHSGARRSLGWLYLNGLGVSKDLDKARDLYQRTADQGDPGGQWGLGWLYQNGFGVARDFYKAAELYQKSADQGYPAGQAGLGWLYQNGWGVPKDLDKAFALYQKAADQGHPGAQASLGWLYLQGLGVPKNFFRAAELLQKAADQGHVGAQSNLGYLYSTGQGVEKDYNKARELLQKAADQGDAHAQYNLGCMYSAGKGVPRDHRKALELYRKAADQGDPDAQKALQTQQRFQSR